MFKKVFEYDIIVYRDCKEVKILKVVIDLFRGFCMALADSVPGVSGGTIAFILGFYDKFIGSLNDLIYGKKKEKKIALKFLIKLGIGWGIGMILAILVLTSLFENNIYSISSLFLGFVVFAIPLIIKEEKKELKGKYQNIIFSVLGILVVCLITYFNPVSGSESSVNFSNMNLGLIIYIFVSAMIAISAMVLPGISGSTLLLIFGVYIPVMSAVKEVMHFNFKYLPAVIVFGLGVIIGIILIIKFVKLALEKQRSKAIYTIIGLMIGSLYAIVMGPTTLEVAKDAMNLSTFSIIFFIIGGLIIIGLDRLKNVIDK